MKLVIFTLQAICIAGLARYCYVLGLKDADFDRVTANLKLQQCLDIIKKGE